MPRNAQTAGRCAFRNNGAIFSWLLVVGCMIIVAVNTVAGDGSGEREPVFRATLGQNYAA